MEDFKNCKLEFLKQQEKQRKEDLKQLEMQQEDLKGLQENIERQEEDSRNYSNVLQIKTTREI